jgi:NAD(P)-dependent dehydrogenase (short-subunit alcohol dehydrogenase family)
MTQAVMPALRAARDGGGDARIVMIGSIGGRVAGPMLGAYHASKFGLVGLTDSLRAELAPSGIPVVLLEPGAVATPIWGRGRTAADEMTDGLSDQAKQRYARQFASVRADAARAERRGLPAERVATVVRTAVTASRPRARYLVGPDAHIGALLGRLSFRLARRLTAARG